MPFDANGNFTRNMNWQDDAANDIPILASRHDDEDDNFANGFNNTVCRDGRAAMTGALKMGGYKVTGMADGTASTDAVTKSQLDAQNVSLTAAIGAKADDNAVVKLSGNQTIAGTKTFSSSPVIPTPSASDNSTKAATTAWIKTFAQTSGADYMSTFSKGGNGYFKFTNGLIIQWGSVAASSGNRNVPLPISFSNTNYRVVFNWTGGSSGELFAGAITGKTTSNFTIRSAGGANDRAADWVAIGY